MANPPSDHQSAETDPGSWAPDAQPPLDPPGGLSIPPTNPYVPPLPLAGTPNADISPQVPSQGLIRTLVPPLQTPGSARIIQAGAGAANVLPLSLASSQQPNQANLVPLVAKPVLARSGPQRAWVIAVPLGGLAAFTARASYRDLKMTPGIRGIVFHGSGGTDVRTVTCNWTGQIYGIPTGLVTCYIPIYMQLEVIDLTFASSTTFPAGAQALLLTEEQIPFSVLA